MPISIQLISRYCAHLNDFQHNMRGFIFMRLRRSSIKSKRAFCLISMRVIESISALASDMRAPEYHYNAPIVAHSRI